jgi:uncharacterized membrane protein
MLRIILGIVIGYVVMFAVVFTVFTTSYLMMGADGAFQPASYNVSSKWLTMAIPVSIIAALIGGAVCALVSQRGLAVFILADLVLLLGAVDAAFKLNRGSTNEVRTAQVRNTEAMMKANSPTWVVLAIPLIGFVGVWVGGALFLRGERVRESISIQAPVENVFDLASDIATCQRWSKSITNIEMMTDGPMKVGTKWRETRVMMGKPATETLEITSMRPNEHYTIGCESMGSKFSTDMVFTSAGQGTQVTVEMKCQPYTLGARLLSPMSALFMGMIRKCLRDDLTDLKRVAETDA